MNRDQEPPQNRDADNKGHKPLWLTCVWKKAANTSNRTKAVIAVVALVALGLARISVLQDESSKISSEPVIPTQMQFVSEPDTAQRVNISAEPIMPAATDLPAVGVDEYQVGAVALESEPMPPSLNYDDSEKSSPSWLFALLGLAIALIGGVKLAKWTEDNGEDMKTIEDKLNKKSKKPKEKGDPKP